MNNECLHFTLKKLFSSLKVEIEEAELVQCSDSWQCKDKAWDSNQIYYVIDGEFHIVTDTLDRVIKQGEMVLIPAGVHVTCEKTVNNKLYKYWIKFKSDFNTVNVFELIKTNTVITIENKRDAEDLFYNLIFKNNCVAPAARIMYRNSYLMMILALFIDNAMTDGITLSRYGVDFEKIISYMYDNMHRDLSVSELASLAHLSNDYFSQLFRQTFFVSPVKFLNEMRIERAKELLSEGEMKITEVAEKVGFNDVSHFNKTFKKQVGYSPRKSKTYTVME